MMTITLSEEHERNFETEKRMSDRQKKERNDAFQLRKDSLLFFHQDLSEKLKSRYGHIKGFYPLVVTILDDDTPFNKQKWKDAFLTTPHGHPVKIN